MHDLTDFGTLAYTKVEELEHKIVVLSSKVKQLEILYGTTPPPPDPNDTEDTEYIVPAEGEVLTTGKTVTVPVYYSSNATTSFPNLYFTSSSNTTIIIKLNLEFLILSNPVTVTVELYVDNTLFDSYVLTSPVSAMYTIPFADSYISTQVGHKIYFKIIPSTDYMMTYKIVNAKYEILGTNVDILNEPKYYSVYYNNGIYYISHSEQGYSNYLIQSISGLNLNADYTQHQIGAIEQKFCHSYEKIDNVWQPTNLGYIYKLGNGVGYITNFEDTTKKISTSAMAGMDYIPNLSTYYGGTLVLAANTGALYYYDVTPTFSSRVTRTLESGVSFYVSVAAVKILRDNFNVYPQKAKLVATRLDGTNVFFSAVSSFYKVELGYGCNVHAFYANEAGTIIDVFMRVYNELVKKVLTYNTTTSKFELTSETSIGTWDEYILGAPPAYFTVTNNELSYNAS